MPAYSFPLLLRFGIPQFRNVIRVSYFLEVRLIVLCTPRNEAFRTRRVHLSTWDLL